MEKQKKNNKTIFIFEVVCVHTQDFKSPILLTNQIAMINLKLKSRYM